MVVHFFTFSDAKGGSSRQRVFRVVEELRTRNINAVIHTPPVLFISRTRWPKKFVLIVQVIRALCTIRKGDIVYLQRTISNKYFFVLLVAYLSIFRRKMIFDFDDPVYLHSFFKTKVFTQMADVVVVCTHGQKEWALQYNKNVHILHIALDHLAYAAYTKNYTEKADRYTIGWVGSGPEHLKNLEILANVFTKLVPQTNIPFRLVLIGAVGRTKVRELFESIPGLAFDCIDALNWTDQSSVPKEIQKFDIGVIPHQSSGAWNESKSSFKVLEYMACGVAVVCSRFGEMPYIIEHETQGFLPQTEEEWVQDLQRLLGDRALQARLGKAGQERVAREYSFAVLLPRLHNILTALEHEPNR